MDSENTYVGFRDVAVPVATAGPSLTIGAVPTRLEIASVGQHTRILPASRYAE